MALKARENGNIGQMDPDVSDVRNRFDVGKNKMISSSKWIRYGEGGGYEGENENQERRLQSIDRDCIYESSVYVWQREKGKERKREGGREGEEVGGD